MWPQEFVELKHIENLLVCGICYEYMDTCVITSCSHNYCSLCIRKYLHYKTQCPACFSETFEKDLRTNKVVDEIIAQFRKVRDKLKICVRSHLMFTQCNSNENVLGTPKSKHEFKDVQVDNQENSTTCNSPTLKNNASPSASIQRDVSTPSTSGKHSRIPLMFTPKSYNRSNVISTEGTKVVICPVCKVTVSETNINRHLDDCLKREALKEKPQIMIAKREPLPKLVFNLMKDAMIKRKLKEFGLSLQGDRKSMEARLQRYIVLYNAECDKANPRSVPELIKQCEDEENIEKKINKSSIFLPKLQINRNTEQNIIEEERKKYLEANKDSFENLIKKVKDTKPIKKSPVRRCLLTENIENKKDIPEKQETNYESDDSVTNNQQNNFESIVYIQDSDSDASCSPINSSVKKAEENDIDSDILSDISVPSKEIHSIIGTSFCKPIIKNDSKNSPNTSTYKKLLQRKEVLSVNNKMNRVNSVTPPARDIRGKSVLDRDATDNEKSDLLDSLTDISSNDSFDRKTHINREILNDSITSSLNVEKENMSMFPECSKNPCQKRSCDAMQSDNQAITNTKKRIKKSSRCNLSGTRELNYEEPTFIQNERKNVFSPKRSKIKEYVANTPTNIPNLRKSTRTRKPVNSS